MGSPSSRVSVRRTALLLVALLGASSGAAAPAWHVMRTPRFLLVSQLSEPVTRAWATEFNQFVDALGTQIKIEESRLPALTIVLFAEAKDFAPYRLPQPNGTSREIAGFFATRETWSVIGLPAQFNSAGTRQTVFHECTHWVESSTPAQLPLWMSEGLAEVFATFERIDGKAYWGRPIDSHVALLKTGHPLPLEQLLAVGPNAPLFNDADETRGFYAESWAFMHYLVFGVRTGDARAIDRYLIATANGANAATAFASAFGVNPAEMDRELDAYLGHGLYRTHIRSSATDTVGPMAYQTASPALVATALARLALGSGRRDLVHENITRAVTLDSEKPEPYEVLAFIRADEGDAEAAMISARRALDLGSQDAWMHVFAARGLHAQTYNDGTFDESVARQIADSFEQAIERRPTLRTAYAGLGRMIESIESLTEQDLRCLLLGRRQFPQEGEILLGLIAAAHKAGADNDAEAMLAQLRAPENGFTEDLRDRARIMAIQWEMATRQARLSALIQSGELPEALAEYPGLLALPIPVEMHAAFSLQRDHLAGQIKLDAARAALAEGRLAVARQLVQELAAMPRIPRILSNAAGELLSQIDQAGTASPSVPPRP